jgi:hypothetical protein
MPYNFDLAVSARISSSVAEEMIRKIVEEQTGKTVATVETKMRKVTKGIGPSESTETVFDGFHVFFEAERGEKSVARKNPSSGFVPTTYS